MRTENWEQQRGKCESKYLITEINCLDEIRWGILSWVWRMMEILLAQSKTFYSSPRKKIWLNDVASQKLSFECSSAKETF